MLITTTTILALLAPLAIGLVCAFTGASFARPSMVAVPSRTEADRAIDHANFERAFDRYVEDRFNEGNPDYNTEEK
jgi:hypothetical protein